MIEQRVESLVVRGVELAWVNGFSTIAVRALCETGARAAAERIAAMLMPVERQARLGWMTGAAICEVDGSGYDDAELLGAHAAADGVAAVTALIARLGDRAGAATELARAAAVVAAPGLRAALRDDVLAQVRYPLDEEMLGYGLGYNGANDHQLGLHLGVAACAVDPETALHGLLEKIAEFAVADARCYADDALAARDDPDGIVRAKRRADKAYAEMFEPSDSRRRNGLGLARACRDIAAGGASDYVRAIVARLEQQWGPPRGWPIDPDHAAHVLCAANRVDDAFKLESSYDVTVKISVAAALVRTGESALAIETLGDVLERSCLVTRRFLPGLYLDLATRLVVQRTGITCRELTHLAEIAAALDDGARTRLRDRLAAAIAALPATIAAIC